MRAHELKLVLHVGEQEGPVSQGLRGEGAVLGGVLALLGELGLELLGPVVLLDGEVGDHVELASELRVTVLVEVSGDAVGESAALAVAQGKEGDVLTTGEQLAVELARLLDELVSIIIELVSVPDEAANSLGVPEALVVHADHIIAPFNEELGDEGKLVHV